MSQETLDFEYGVLEAEKQRVIQQRTNEIKSLMRRSSQDIIDIGHNLIEVKQHLGHGSFRNWLRIEFNWSVSTATKFMQVWEQFKCVNFTHLNITASTLYLIAAPSTPKEARDEVLERSSNGENIGYTNAKKIVSQYRKTKKGAVEPKIPSLQLHEPVKVIETMHYQTSEALIKKQDLTPKETRTQEESQTSVVFENQQVTNNIKDIVTIYDKTSDATVEQMAISISNLTLNQLAEVIIKAANNGLSENHLSTMIMTSQQVLNTR